LEYAYDLQLTKKLFGNHKFRMKIICHIMKKFNPKEKKIKNWIHERVTFCGRPTKDNEGANDGGNTC
jgi:hypothetical protein